jgi:hypothetical protein
MITSITLSQTATKKTMIGIFRQGDSKHIYNSGSATHLLYFSISTSCISSKVVLICYPFCYLITYYSFTHSLTHVNTMLRDDLEKLTKDEYGIYEPISPPVYQPVIPSKRKRIFLFFSINSYYWAIYRLSSEVVMMLTFGSAATVGLNTVAIGSLSLLSTYMLFVCVVAPLWQCFAVQKVSTSEEVGCEHGCMAGMACVHLGGVCSCRNLLVIRNDKLGGFGAEAGTGWWSEPLESDGMSSPQYSRSNTTSSVASMASSSTNTPSISRFIPFSLYNLIYIITHHGRQELNPELPYDQMPAFGMGRSMLLCFGTSIRASLSLALFYNAYYAVLVQDGLFFRYMSLISLLSAFTDLDVYLVAVFYGTILYPYSLVVWLALYFPMFDWLLNPKQGTFLFWMLKKYWKTVVSCISVDREESYPQDRDEEP